MEDSQTLPSKQEVEEKIQEAKATIESNALEMQNMLDEGVKDTINKLHVVYMKLRQLNPAGQEAQKLREEKHILFNDDQFLEYRAASVRLLEAQEHLHMAEFTLKMLKAREARPLAPLPEISLPKTTAPIPPLPGSTEQSKFFSSHLRMLCIAWNITYVCCLHCR